jgi:hypothetical protein
MTRYERVVQILDESIGGSNVNIGVHGAFWRGLSRDQFVAKKIFNRDLVVVGNGSASNLVKALKQWFPGFYAALPARSRFRGRGCEHFSSSSRVTRN